jgi:hypothetical protein
MMATMAAQATIIPFESGPALHETEPQTRGYMVGLVRRLTPEWFDEELGRAAEAGFNLAIFPAYSNGWTLFQSETARQGRVASINPLFRRWDPLASLAGIAAARGMKLWALVRPYNFHPRHAIAEHKLLKKNPCWRLRPHPGVQVWRTRLDEERQACPLNPEYRRYVAELMTELVGCYPIEGVVLDFTGFSLQAGPLEAAPYCFCASCRERYRRTNDAEMIEDALGQRLARVRDWQARQAAESLSYLRHRLIRARRSIRFMCRARPHWRDALPDGRGRPEGHDLLDWPALLADGTVEELLVDHDNETCHAQFGGRLAADYAFLGDRVMFQPILSVDDPPQVENVVAALARYPIPGLLVDFQRGLNAMDVRRLRERAFPLPAAVPESDPVSAAVFLIERVRRAHENQRIIHDLLADFLRLLKRELPSMPKFATLQMIEQNLHGLEQYIRRGRLGSSDFPEATLRDLGLARRFIRMACLDVRS